MGGRGGADEGSRRWRCGRGGRGVCCWRCMQAWSGLTSDVLLRLVVKRGRGGRMDVDAVELASECEKGWKHDARCGNERRCAVRAVVVSKKREQQATQRLARIWWNKGEATTRRAGAACRSNLQRRYETIPVDRAARDWPRAQQRPCQGCKTQTMVTMIPPYASRAASTSRKKAGGGLRVHKSRPTRCRISSRLLRPAMTFPP